MTQTIDSHGNEVKPIKNTFWLDGWEGECHSGYYIRSDLFKKVEEFKKMGHKVVGIGIEDGSWNLQFICEKKEINQNEKTKT